MSAGASWRGRHLVEQRLELVVVVAVEERDVDVVLLGEPLRAADAGEAAADHDTWRCRCVLMAHARLPALGVIADG